MGGAVSGGTFFLDINEARLFSLWFLVRKRVGARSGVGGVVGLR